MATHNVEGNEVLLLTTEDGEMYAIPRDVVERHRVTGERKAAIESELGEDVSGYSMYQHFINQQLAGYHQAESRQAAAEERLGRQAQENENPEPSPRAANRPAAVLRAAIVGMWRTLPFA
jgi:hypothetical protein